MGAEEGLGIGAKLLIAVMIVGILFQFTKLELFSPTRD